MSPETIYAAATGRPPAAIAIVRVSGRDAFTIGHALAGPLPSPGRTRLRALRDPADGSLLDRALVLSFAGPASATGEDVIEFHLHGGRAVIAAVERAIATFPRTRLAEPGEFTRRALMSGRIDLAEAEGLGDLLMAETEAQRRMAMASAEGVVGRAVRVWAARCLEISARLEAVIDYADEDDALEVGSQTEPVRQDIAALARDIRSTLEAPPVERLRDGIRVVLAGPPNSGKSSLFNVLCGRDAAIVASIAGTTRDRIEAPVTHNGFAYVLIDTAGLRNGSDDPIETMGIDRSRDAMATAEIVLWLGDEPPPVDLPAIGIHARADLPGREHIPSDRVAVSAETLMGIRELWSAVEDKSISLMPRLDQLPLNARHRKLCARALRELVAATDADDMLLVAEHLRATLRSFDEITGAAGVENVLDALFQRFCLGK